MQPKLIIFDMDGTVLDTLEDLLGAMNYALERFGYPQHTLDEMRTFVGNGLRKQVERALPAGASAEEVDKVLEAFKGYYLEHLNVRTKPYPGIVDYMRFLRSKGIKVAIASNKVYEGAQLLADAHFGSLVNVCVGESNEIPKKPDPTGVEIILRLTGAGKEETLYVGDSVVDIETAKNAGLECVCVGWGFQSEAQLRAAGAGRVVFTPDDIILNI